MGQLLGDNMRQLRGRKDQKTVADAIGISRSALSMYERGARTPGDDIKMRIAAYYNVSVEDLFFSTDFANRATSEDDAMTRDERDFAYALVALVRVMPLDLKDFLLNRTQDIIDIVLEIQNAKPPPKAAEKGECVARKEVKSWTSSF